MARGWESKSVEAQQEEAQSRPVGWVAPTTEDQDRKRRRESLLLTRKRIEHQLESVQNDRYRQMLEQELEAVNKQLDELK